MSSGIGQWKKRWGYFVCVQCSNEVSNGVAYKVFSGMARNWYLIWKVFDGVGDSGGMGVW
jgi:hypothetical protein